MRPRILGRYKQAKTAIDEAVIISQNFHNILGLGYSYLTRGRLATINLGLYKEATQTINLALNYLNKMGTVHASVAQVDLARTYHLQGALDPAEQLYRQALAGFEASHSSLAVSRCLNWLGCLLLDRGALQGAEQCQRDSLAILQESEPKPALLAAALLYLGQVLVAAGPEGWAEALESLRKALELITENQLAPLALELCVAAVPLLEQEGQRDQALDLLALAAGHELTTADIRQKARYALNDRRQPSALDIQTNPDPAALPEMWPAVQKLRALLAEQRRP